MANEKRHGASGTQITHGRIRGEESSPDFDALPDKITIMNKMRNDPQVAGCFEAISKPIISAKYDIQFPEHIRESEGFNESESEKKLDVMREALFEMPKSKFSKIMKVLVWALAYGFRYMEKIYLDDKDKVYTHKFRDGKERVTWYSWEDRLPSAHNKWITAPGSQALTAIEQYAPKPDDEQAGSASFLIPREQLVLVVHEQEGMDFTGRGIWRAIYRPWFVNNRLHTVEAIAAERWGTGIIHGKVTEVDVCRVGSPEWTATEEMLAKVGSHEQAFILTPFGIDVDMLGMPGTREDVRKAIDANNREIAIRQLLHILEVGMTEHGSRDVASLQQAMFEGGLSAFADEISDAITADAIEPLWRLWWPEDTYTPELTHARIEVRNLDRLAASLGKLVDSGIIRADDDLEGYVRDMGDLPPANPSTRREKPSPIPQGDPAEPDKGLPKKDQAVDDGDDDADEGGATHAASRGFPFREEQLRVWGIRREPTEFEAKVIDFEFISSRHAEGEENIKRHFVKFLPMIFNDIADTIEQGKDVMKTPIPAAEDIKNALYGEMLDAARAGAEAVSYEMMSQGADLQNSEVVDKLVASIRSPISGQYISGSATIRKVLRKRAEVHVDSLMTKYKVSAQKSYLRGMEVNKELAEIAAIAMNDLVNLSAVDIERAARENFRKAFGYGRNRKQEQFAQEFGWEKYVYSAIFDLQLCENCAPFDHMVHGGEITAPNPNCLGGDSCR